MQNIQLDDFTKYKFLSNIEYSPNGQYGCFVVHEADVAKNGYRSNLWVYSVDEHQAFQLTSGDSEKAFLWSSDSEHILFPASRTKEDRDKQEAGEEFTVFYKISIHGGEAQEAFRIPLRVGAIKNVSDSAFVFTSTFNPNRTPLIGLPEQERSEELKRRKEEKDYEVLEEIPFWSNGGGFTSGNRERLYIFDVPTTTYAALTDGKIDVEGFNLSADKRQIVFLGQAFEGKMETQNAVYLLTLSDKSLRQLTPDERFRYSYAAFLDADTVICSGSDMKRFGMNENAQFYRIDLATGARTALTPEFRTSTWNSVGSDCRYGGARSMKVDGEWLYFITTENDSSFINRVDKSGRMERVTTAKGSVDDYDVNKGDVLFVGMRDMKLQELYRLESSERQLTHFNDWVHGEKTVVPLEALSFETEPGVVIDGWVMKPVNFDASRQYPAILNIHGGPKTVYGEVFFHEMQYWANEGYFVFFCNPRGSDGKANEFADIRGQYGTIDYDDLMRFTDVVLEKYPNIDSERLGVTGGSYGGYMTNWIIGHTNRFKAAASQRSISNWISKFCTTDIGYYFVDDQIDGTPWNAQEKLWWHSPLKYADQVKTPTLFIHSDEDFRCWVVEGYQMFTALKYHGVESRLVMFRGENHELSRSGKPKHRIRRLREITDWFNRYLKA